MDVASSTLSGKANARRDRVAGFNRPFGRSLEAVMRVLHDLYPTKTAAHIAVRTGVNTRSAERWIARERDMNAESFIALLTSQDGDKILQAVMLSLPSKERPRWWLRHVNTARMARIETLQAERDEEIRQLRLEMLK